MKRLYSALLTVAILSPMAAGLSLHTQSRAFANESRPTMEGRGRRWQQLSPEERQAKRAEKAAKMKEDLNLSDAQAEAIEAIHDKYQPQRQTLREEAQALKESGDREGLQALRQQKQDLRQQVKAEMKEVLNSEQVEKLESLKSERRSRRGQKTPSSSSES